MTSGFIKYFYHLIYKCPNCKSPNIEFFGYFNYKPTTFICHNCKHAGYYIELVKDVIRDNTYESGE